MTHPNYQIRIKDHVGTVTVVLTDWKSLEYTNRVNAPGDHTLSLYGNDGSIVYFVVDAQLEVWRKSTLEGRSWYLDYEGLHRTQVEQTTERGETIFTSYGRGYEDLLERRIVAYPAGSAQASQSGKGETVIKAYVSENAGPSATSPPRLANGVVSGLTVEASSGAGGDWEGGRSYRNLLEVVQDIAIATDIDLKVVGDGPATFFFRAKAKPWGSDRGTQGLDATTGLNSAGNVPVVFSLGFGNMTIPVYSLNRSAEINAVYVLGQGQETDRNVVMRSNATTMDSPWNRREVSRQANTEETTAALEDIGDEVLAEFAARETFHFAVLQTASLRYGRDYFIGDIITARYKDVERHYQIVSVTIRVSEGREDIDVEVSNIAK